MKKVLLGMLMAGAAMGTSASAAVITFDPYSPTDQGLSDPVSIGGLDFSNNFYQAVWADGSPNANNGTNKLIYGFTPLTITKTGGGSFVLNGLDLGTSFYAQPAETIGYTLNLTGGGTSTGTLNLTDSFQSFTFGQSVTSVVFGPDSGYVAIDNISFDAGAVPEPASWAMMVGGFATVGGAMRARRKAAIAAA